MPNTTGRKLIVHDKRLSESILASVGRYGITQSEVISLFSDVIIKTVSQVVVESKKSISGLPPEMQRIEIIRNIYRKVQEITKENGVS